MSDLRWSDCDELASSDPIACLLCRTGRLNDHAHQTDLALAKIKSHVHWFGIITTALGLLSAAASIWRAITGN